MSRRPFRFALAAALLFVVAPVRAGTPFVPGTGEFLDDCSDDFEDPSWTYTLRLPKSSSEQDENSRPPGGFSNNHLWAEGALRGTPDVVKRVPTPPGGIEGSTGALLFATKYSGIPGRPSGKQQQDDLLMKFDRRLGRSIPVSWQPSCTVRVYLPPFDQWEHRNGPSFGMRCDCRGRKPNGKMEPYWPGMFWLFRKANGKSVPEDYAQLTIRSGTRGNDPQLTAKEPGWWTMGMSFTPDGQIHYYASPGVDDLTAEDYLASYFPYGNRCMTFNNFFFNVANWDNGRRGRRRGSSTIPNLRDSAAGQSWRNSPLPREANSNQTVQRRRSNKSSSPNRINLGTAQLEQAICYDSPSCDVTWPRLRHGRRPLGILDRRRRNVHRHDRPARTEACGSNCSPAASRRAASTPVPHATRSRPRPPRGSAEFWAGWQLVLVDADG